MITSEDIPEPKPEPNHRPLPVFSSQAGLASFTTDRENGSGSCKTCGGGDVRCEDCGEAFGW